MLRAPAAHGGDPSHGVRAVPAVGSRDSVSARVAPELQHQRLRRDLQPRPAGGRRLLQLPEGVRLWRPEDVPHIIKTLPCS